MPPKNSTVAGSLLLTTLLTNCQILPITQSLLQAERAAEADRYGSSQEAASLGRDSWSAAAAARGGGLGDAGGQRLVDGDVGAVFYSRDSRTKAATGGEGGEGKWSSYRRLEEAKSANGTQVICCQLLSLFVSLSFITAVWVSSFA